MTLKFIGNPGEGIPGIPGRDLTTAEVKKHGRAFLLRTGLYKESKADKKRTRSNKAIGPKENKSEE